ncbi:CSC1-like protein ERD4 [Castanea sativa]|uniref:CSC1-like protein ERD4 n=1 Tax=Castanea sativa TaxID=21020 RepID=UPI003F64E54F
MTGLVPVGECLQLTGDIFDIIIYLFQSQLSFVGYGLELSRIVPLIIYHLKRKYLCKTESELKEAWLPGDVGYGTCVPSDMLVFTIVLCYSVMGPIIIPFGVAYFGLGWLILRNQVSKKFYRFFHDTSREVACDNLKKSPNMEQVFRSYILPSLNSENNDDDQF